MSEAKEFRSLWLKDPKDKSSLVPMKELSNEELQRAYTVTQRNVLKAHNKTLFFGNLQEEIELEASERQLKLLSIEEVKENVGDFFKNSKVLKK